jgi:hypothetical protein
VPPALWVAIPAGRFATLGARSDSDERSPLPAAVVSRRHRRLFCREGHNGRPLIFIYYGEGVGHRSLARLLTRNAARRIAAGIAKLPELLRRS